MGLPCIVTSAVSLRDAVSGQSTNIISSASGSVAGGTVVGGTVVGGTVVGGTVVGGTVVGGTVVGGTVVGATVVGGTVVGGAVLGTTEGFVDVTGADAVVPVFGRFSWMLTQPESRLKSNRKRISMFFFFIREIIKNAEGVIDWPICLQCAD